MSLAAKTTPGELALGLILKNPVWFKEFFMKDAFYLGMGVSQRVMASDTSTFQLRCTARKTSKTTMIESDVLQTAVTCQNTNPVPSQGMFVTPSLNHMKPTLDRIVSRINQTPLFKVLCTKMDMGNGILEFSTGFRWNMRLEGTSGDDRNVVGLSATIIIGDEMAFSNWGAYNGMQQTALPNCKWVICGVPNGVRNTPLYSLDQQERGSKFSHHKLIQQDNPLYIGEEMRQQLVAEHGGEHTQDYQTQVLGNWGDPSFATFNPEQIHTDTSQPYFSYELTDDIVKECLESGRELGSLFPGLVPPRDIFAAGGGMDVGSAADPSVILMAYQDKDPFVPGQGGVWRIHARVTLYQMYHLHQAKIVDYLNQRLFNGAMQAYYIDQQGYGRSVSQDLIQASEFQSRGYSRTVMDANFGGDVEIMVEEFDEYSETAVSVAKKMGSKEWMTTTLRDLFYERKLFHPPDDSGMEEILSCAESKTEKGRTVYKIIKRAGIGKGAVADHYLDSLRCLARTIKTVTGDGSKGISGLYVDGDGALGWIGETRVGRSVWKPPWSMN